MLGDLQRHIFLRLIRRCPQMRGADHILKPKKRAVGCGFNLEHIQGSAGNMAGLQSLRQSRLIHQAAARAIDQPRALFHARDILA